MSTCSLTHTDFQKWIGYNDVKSQPVYFYVQKNTSFSTPYTPIPFEIERLNIGGANGLEIRNIHGTASWDLLIFFHRDGTLPWIPLPSCSYCTNVFEWHFFLEERGLMKLTLLFYSKCSPSNLH